MRFSANLAMNDQPRVVWYIVFRYFCDSETLQRLFVASFPAKTHQKNLAWQGSQWANSSDVMPCLFSPFRCFM